MHAYSPEHKGVAVLLITGEAVAHAFKQSSRNGKLMREMIESIIVDSLTISR